MNRFGIQCFALALSVALAGCESVRPPGAAIGPRLTDKEYEKAMSGKTRWERRYDGFYQVYEAYATLIDSDVQSLVLQRRSDVYQWNQDLAQKEREKMFQENSNITKFVLVLFTPRARLNDLNTKNTIWKVILEVNGQRFDGESKRLQGPHEAISSVYPTHNRFTTAYEITFKTPMSAVEKMSPKFVLTSSLGTSTFQY
jgi:hypothetical protein